MATSAPSPTINPKPDMPKVTDEFWNGFNCYSLAMDIEVKDLEDDFSNVFAKVLDGQVIQVTRLGVPIALIQPIQSGIPAQFLDKDLVRLPVRTGPIGLGTRFRSVQTTSEALQEDRGA